MESIGRESDRPTQIPARGWGQITRRVIDAVGEDRILLVAGGVTFFLLLSLVPTLVAIVAVYGLVTDPAEVERQMQFLSSYLPGSAQEIVRGQLTRLSDQTSSSLGLASAAGLLAALWSSNRGTKAVIQALNIAYEERETRGFFKLLAVSLTFTFGAVLLFVSLMAGIVLVPRLDEWLPFGTLGSTLTKLGTALFILLVGTFGLACLFRWAPDREAARWSWLTPGAAVALVVGAIASMLFSWYVSSFGSFNETYGSLGAVIGFMTWLWIMTIFVLLGAELNAEMEHQTTRDTTTGPERPMGSRGARMADSVAH